MPEQVNWGTFTPSFKSKSKSGKIQNLRLDPGDHKVRIIGKPVMFYKYYVSGPSGGTSAICEDPSTCPIREKYGIEPTARFAANVLDRNDGDTLKIMEFTQYLFDQIVVQQTKRNIENVGADTTGYDVSITVTGVKPKTKSTVVILDKAPFTDKEKEYITQNIYDLKKIYQACPKEEIENKLYPKKVEEKKAADLPF